jgi:hypothetical protein
MFFLLSFHLVEQGVQALVIGRPKTPIPFQPHLEFLERGGPQRIDSPLRVHANADQSSLTEYTQMFGDLWLAKTQPIDHVPDGPGPIKQQFDDLKAVRFGQRSKCFDHDES